MTALPPNMAAAVTLGHGGPEQTEVRSDWPTPRPGPGQAVVRVTAAALNNTDIWSRQGAYGSASDPDAIAGWRGVPLSFPRIQGIDAAGMVAAVGDGVDGGWVDRRVIVDPAFAYDGPFPVEIIGSEVDGGFCEYHLCSQSQLREVTGSPLSDAQLACLPTAYGTALGMINRAPVGSGDRVLVTGASGGVGMAAVQMLVAKGAEVVARTSESKRDLVAAAGVAELSVRGVDNIRALDRVKAAFDVVGGDEFAGVMDRVAPGGHLVVAGAIAGPVFPFDVRQLYLEQRTLVGSTMHTPADFEELAGFAVSGSVDPIVAETFALTDIAAAQERFLAKDFVGKLVLLP